MRSSLEFNALHIHGAVLLVQCGVVVVTVQRDKRNESILLATSSSFCKFPANVTRVAVETNNTFMSFAS